VYWSNIIKHNTLVKPPGNINRQHHNMSSQPPEPPKPADAEAPTAPPSLEDNPESTNTSQNPTSETAPTNPRLTALQIKKTTLQQTLATLQLERQHLATLAKLPSGLPIPTTNPSSGEALPDDELLASALKASSTVIKSHIALLHKYNEIKDIGQGLMGLIADKRDCRVVGVMEEFGVGEGD
jgi:DNA repair protein Swi5/Sae3